MPVFCRRRAPFPKTTGPAGVAAVYPRDGATPVDTHSRFWRSECLRIGPETADGSHRATTELLSRLVEICPR